VLLASSTSEYPAGRFCDARRPRTRMRSSRRPRRRERVRGIAVARAKRARERKQSCRSPPAHAWIWAIAEAPQSLLDRRFRVSAERPCIGMERSSADVAPSIAAVSLPRCEAAVCRPRRVRRRSLVVQRISHLDDGRSSATRGRRSVDHAGRVTDPVRPHEQVSLVTTAAERQSLGERPWSASADGFACRSDCLVAAASLAAR